MNSLYKCDDSLKYFIFYFKNLRVTSNKNTLGERGSDDKKVGEFVHSDVFERQTPSKVIHGEITDWVIIQIKMNVFISSWCKVETLNPEMIFCKSSGQMLCSYLTSLMTDLSVNVHKTGRLSGIQEIIFHLKDEKSYESIIAIV